jgi:hypothetical protein
MRKNYYFALFIALLSPLLYANDFPTLARVEYVAQCMNEHGRHTYDTLYGCSCSLDVVASILSYEEYTEAYTFERLLSIPGERGSVFRDPPRSKALREKLGDARQEAEKRCFFSTKRSP